MAEISVYTLEDREGNEFGSFQTQNFEKAERYAKEASLRVIENVFEWTEAIPVEGADYTGQED